MPRFQHKLRRGEIKYKRLKIDAFRGLQSREALQRAMGGTGAERLTSLAATAQGLQFRFGLRFVHELRPTAWSGKRPGAEPSPLIDRSPLASPETRPLPVFRVIHEIRSQRVSFHIPGHLIEVVVRLDGERFEAALVNVSLTNALAVLLPARHMRHCQSLHERR